MQLSLWTSSAADSPASPGASPGSDEARKMTATSGRKCIGSWLNSGPLGCLERTLLASSAWGSTEFFLTWSSCTTPAGRLLFRLAPSMPRTAESECGSWPTPQHQDGAGMGGVQSRIDGRQMTSPAAAKMASCWPKPSARDWKSGQASQDTMDRNARPLNEVATWSTPRATDGEKGGPNQSFGAGGKPLPSMAAWATPQAQNSKGIAPENCRWSAGGKAYDKWTGLQVQTSIDQQVKGIGPMPNGSDASSTARRGALNPEFVCWLQGYPEGWLD